MGASFPTSFSKIALGKFIYWMGKTSFYPDLLIWAQFCFALKGKYGRV